MPTYHWFRTHDHPAAKDRTVQLGERQWNVDFVDDHGVLYRIHVGEESRKGMLAMLAEEEVRVVTGEIVRSGSQ